MSGLTKLHSRYELKEVLGRGGMGVVYKAYDTLMKREVAIKTIVDVQSRTALDLFYREWGLQASIIHPNIIEIYDIGEFEEEGAAHPFFVMPLLPGQTLETLVRASSHRLTVERTIDIICQTCRGLQAAHERSLIHRDLKPSNVFVMDDDSVKIIDFGIAHSEGSQQTSLRGTLAYMAPELFQMKPPSVQSDIFALGVVCYETLSGRRPFEGNSDVELANAIMHHNPPPVSDLNAGASQTISRVIHKAMAKQPWHRYTSAREFGETLQKALHNERIDLFDPSKVQPRVERAARAFDRGEYQVASEILNELEGEGHIDQEITMLRRKLEQAVRRTTIRQILESARRFDEEEEYGLALRKVQEALQLDASDTDALALKNQIEKKRREKKVDEWSQLARQHLDNNAFGHARNAIQSLLEMKPDDTQALEMMAEVKRREQDFERVRGEKARSYEAAMQSWERGDVSSAYSKLQRWLALDREAPESDSDRLLASQNFYNQVRTEHESMRNSYDQARQQLAEQNFIGARAICEEYLNKYPGHALFHALKFDVEERQRQSVSAYIAETDRRVETEPDLERRCRILEEAVKLHPGEPHFEGALRLAREKRDLVNSVAAKARLFEEQGRFAEAVDQWEILRAIHAAYPGLDYEVSRLTSRRDTQARTDARAQWVAQIDASVESRDYQRALQLCDKALAEFPDDAELGELRKLAHQRVNATTEAMQMLAQGKDRFTAGEYDEGLDIMRQAYHVDEGNSVIRAVMVDALVQRARALLDSDWPSADRIIGQLNDLDPSHPAVASLRAMQADKKREEFVSECTAQARRLQTAGDLAAAHALIEQGLQSYPQEPRLASLRATLDRARQDQRSRQTRDRDLEALQGLEQDLADTEDRDLATALASKALKIASRYKAEGEFQAIAESIRRKVSSAWPDWKPPVTSELRTATSAQPPRPVTPSPKTPSAPHSAPPLSSDFDETAPLSPVTPRAMATSPQAPQTPRPPSHTLETATVPFTEIPVTSDAPAESAPPVTPPPAPPASQSPTTTAIAPQAPPPAPPPGGPKPARKSKLPLLLAGAAAAVVLIGVGGYLFKRSRPVPVPTVRVDVRTTPTGARIRVNGQDRGASNMQMNLAPGSYQLETLLEGYQSQSSSFTAKDTPVSLDLTLRPLAGTIRLFSDSEGTKATLDDKQLNPIQEGEFAIEAADANPHKLRLTDRQGQAEIEIQVAPAKMPEVHGPVQGKNLSLLVVTQFGGKARVSCNCAPLKVGADGREPQPVPPEGLELELGTGNHELAIDTGSGARKLALETPAAPNITAFVVVKSADKGALTVVTNEDNVSVFLNGNQLRRQTRRGRLRIPDLAEAEYEVRVAKDGYEQTPPQKVAIHKGEEAKLEFQLKPVARMATLRLQGMPPGALVFADGNPLGAIEGDGSFSYNLTPGDHTLELRKDPARSKPLQRHFNAGETVQLGPTDLALNQQPGTLRFKISPATARVTIRLESEPEAQARVVSQESMTVPDGTYVINATAPKYSSYVANIPIASGATKVVEIALRPLEEKKAAPTIQAFGMNDWDEPGGWVKDGDVQVHKGGNFVTYRPTPVNGTIIFTAALRRGRRLQWFVNYSDDKNHVLFRVDKNNFYRLQVLNGKTKELAKAPHQQPEKEQYFSFRIDVKPEAIEHAIRRGNEWVKIDSWQAPGAQFSSGKFGLYIPGRDEYAVSFFLYTPR